MDYEDDDVLTLNSSKGITTKEEKNDRIQEEKVQEGNIKGQNLEERKVGIILLVEVYEDNPRTVKAIGVVPITNLLFRMVKINISIV